MPNNYIIITPAYNEEAYIERTLKSVIKQSILPIEWIIVDDGSTDKTAEIVKDYASKYNWIKLYSFKKKQVAFGEHVYLNFYRGFKKVKTNDFQFIVKLDADLDIDRKDFFEFQIDKMKKWKQLGICSGITYSDHTGEKIFTKGRPYWRTGGAMKFYRCNCFEQIGGIKPIYGWDGLDEYLAMFHGWKTRTYFDLPVNHLGKKRAINRQKQLWLAKAKGKSLYQRGYPIEFIIARFLILLFKFKIKLSINFIKGYFKSLYNTRVEQVVTIKEKHFVRKFQYLRIIDKFSKKELL
jgi:glycosyltransferase involved in cell wall biosynthesis